MCHQGDHGLQDHGFVAFGQLLVVADGAAVLADPGERPRHTHLRGSTSKTRRSRLATISRVIFMAVAQAASPPAVYPASAQTRRTLPFWSPPPGRRPHAIIYIQAVKMAGPGAPDRRPGWH